jgi:hypothetical protein
MADWLLVLDSDTIVAKLDNSLDGFLNGDEHVLLHWRPNLEVAAGVVAVRTTDFGACFLRRWISVIQTKLMLGLEANADNGALLLLIAEFLAPTVAIKCSNVTDPWKLVNCFEPVLQHFGKVPSRDVPIRIFPPLSGFWREHIGVVRQAPNIRPCHDQQTIDTMMYKRYGQVAELGAKRLQPDAYRSLSYPCWFRFAGVGPMTFSSVGGRSLVNRCGLTPSTTTA